MSESRPTFFYDFIDPLSYLLAHELVAVAGGDAAADGRITWHPFELRPPPTPLVAVDDESLASRWSEAHRLAEEQGIVLDPPTLVPWTRKAHEFVLLAGEHDVAAAARRRVFEAYHLEGADIGRVDVLVSIALSMGLDRTETKAVLDVDRHQADVAALRDAALSAGVTTTPTLFVDGQRLEGFHNRDRIGTLLGT